MNDLLSQVYYDVQPVRGGGAGGKGKAGGVRDLHREKQKSVFSL